ncbi:apoptosis-inducing factorB-like [Dorcoceras hygrometricum]|uniref:Apoptosis-inducing factorB-like n=1 Tax=Dorcoceras hygrometricum TaxID=472368 RepID=A0A2Z7DIK0_9LAMI|nr:apoptosis-inducing factorB-like [Dorcoceras hygrometricum]
MTLNGSGIQLAVGPQPLWLRNHNSGLAHRIMVRASSTSPHEPLGITDSACKNQLVVVSVQYGPFNPYIAIRSTTIVKSRVAKNPIAMHTSWRSNSDIASVTSIGYPRMSANGESSTTMHRLLHASGSHPIPPPNDPKTNQYNQDLGLIHSTNGNHLESPNEGSSIDHQVTIYLHAQNITMFPTNETCAACFVVKRRVSAALGESCSNLRSWIVRDLVVEKNVRNECVVLLKFRSHDISSSHRVAFIRELRGRSDDVGKSPGLLVPEKSNAIVGVVTTGFECLPPSCDGLTGPDDHGPMISRLIDRGVSGNLAGQSGSSAGRSPHS